MYNINGQSEFFTAIRPWLPYLAVLGGLMAIIGAFYKISSGIAKSTDKQTDQITNATEVMTEKGTNALTSDDIDAVLK
jgi:hypothetical protein